ncbi:MAG: Gp15 family bacteriophage protein [Firmicutes bacterium]|nr:Gp15 family bacteriophage protein [Bacillota bacterium]
MSILTQTLPKGIVSHGHYYAINTDFRTWLKFGELISDKRISTLKKAKKIIELCYKERLPDSFDDAMTALMEFYAPKDAAQKSGGQYQKKEARVFSFSEDADLIYAAFLSEYGIDLCSAELHWWQFRALFSALPQDCRLMQVVGFRSTDPGEIKDSKKRSFYRKMRRIYALGQENEIEPADILAELF